ncbi:unnamed protein product [Moneuplotes crassus]|uniref:Uncharacterized protein n=1 Tax=Euplotes crassus TaxID=5936 RepID=A0AAD1XXH1_EUPCR|nr:unnamed protein product [Moneuplotes crassus]
MIDVRSFLEKRNDYVAAVRQELPTIHRRVLSASPKRREPFTHRVRKMCKYDKCKNSKLSMVKHLKFVVCSDELPREPMTKVQKKEFRRGMKDYLNISCKVYTRLNCFSPGKFNSKRLLEGKFAQFSKKFPLSAALAPQAKLSLRRKSRFA